MAETQHSAAEARDSLAGRELAVDLRPYGWNMWEFQGTRAQLEAEGAIPPATKWPAAGTGAVEWTAGPLRFSLRRVRPAGLKGPKQLWVNGDWWCLRCDTVERFDPLLLRVHEARQALALAIYRLSPAGQRASAELWQRTAAARRDSAFQSFRALVPALNPPQRGRRAGASAD